MNVLFTGRMLNFIECTEIDYKSTRTESFKEIQLDVKGCKDIYESFDKYIGVELMNGLHQYDADGFGLQVWHRDNMYLFQCEISVLWGANFSNSQESSLWLC